MTLFEELTWRGFVNQVTHDELGETLDKEKLTLYCGFDPTADSLHIGSLLPIMGLVHFQRAGHRLIVLMGGGTGLIGDPSGKTQERQLLTQDVIEANVAGQQAQLVHFLEFEGGNPALLLNNTDWLSQLSLVDFLRDTGKHFSVNVMLSRESVKQRINDREQGLSFTEFSYMLLQAYDFLHLFDTHGCTLQIGGSDQWGNIVAGIDLARRLRDGVATYGLTFPLVTKAGGAKFGKSEGGNIWLDPKRTSPYKFYQFWLNQSDTDAGQYLRYFTLLPRAEIEALEQQIQDEPHRRAAQKRLAEEVTQRVHGEAALDNALHASQAMFGGDLSGLDDATLEDVFSEVPSAEQPRAKLRENRPLVDVLLECGVFASKGEARRLIQNGGLYLNNQRVTVLDQDLTENSLCSENMAVIRTGKKNYFLLKFV